MKNEYEVIDGVVVMQLTRGLATRFCVRHSALVGQYRWYASQFGDIHYAMTSVWLPERYRKRAILMHRLVMGVADRSRPLIDHVNRDGLDNTDANLRLATYSQNFANRPAQRRNRTGFKGVEYDEKNRRYRAVFRVDGKRTHLGSFGTAEDAAAAYDEAARNHFGAFALANLPVHDPPPQFDPNE